MLRDRLGKKVFDQGIRNFWAAQRFKVASWDDLQTAFESASGEKLGSFFAPWLEQQALPDVAIARAESIPSGTLHQLKITFTKKDARLPLRLPVEISAAGQRETHWVDLSAQRDTATLNLAFAPQSLRLDPEMRVWRRLDASQLPPILRQWMAASAPQLVNVARASDANLAVNQLSGRFFEVKPKPLAPAQLNSALNGNTPVLLAGTHAEIDQTLASAGLPARPASLIGKGSAQVWTVPDKPFQLAIISGQDAASLNALQRGLPHYGGQSWLIFEQGRVIDKGTWPARHP